MSFVPLLAAFLLSVVLILFGSGPGGSDAKVNLLGWQPVEAIKILVVLFLAGYFFDRWEFLREIAETRAGLPREAAASPSSNTCCRRCSRSAWCSSSSSCRRTSGRR